MAMSLNRAQIIGNITRDPEVRQTPSGQSVTSFGVATNFSWKDSSGQQQTKTEFHNVVAWRRLAEICGQYLRKGSKVYIDGRLQTRDWEGEDGVRRYRTEIIVDNMIMLDRRGEGVGSGGAGAYAADGLSVPPNEGKAGGSAPMSKAESELEEFDEVAVSQEKGSLAKKPVVLEEAVAEKPEKAEKVKAGAAKAGAVKAGAKSAKVGAAKGKAAKGADEEVEIDDLPF